MNGNFDGTGTLVSGGTSVTVSGWVSWAGTAGEPSTCRVTVRVKQKSGQGSADGEATSDEYSEAAPGQHVGWTTEAVSSADPFHPGSADAEAWIKDSQGHTVFKWSANPRLQLS
jgi:hypothetical protein